MTASDRDFQPTADLITGLAV